MQPKVIKLRRWSRSALAGALTEAEIDALERYSTRTRRNREMVALAHRCMALDPAPFIHPLTGTPSACYNSFSHDNLYNLLAFDDGTEPVFVIQRVSWMDALYLPKRGILISFRLLDIHTEKLFEEIDFSKQDLSTVREFAGFIISHHRPYHFFYDVMPAMADIEEGWSGATVEKNALELVQLQSGDYLPVNVLYPEYLCYTSSSTFLNHRTNIRNKYYFKVGYSGLKNERQEISIKRFDRSVLHSRFVQKRENGRTAGADFLTLAFDISNEKGTWQSIREDIPTIVQHIGAELGVGVHVVLDGWTLPHTPSGRDLRRVREEEQLAGSIRRGLEGIASGVDFLVGASPRDKIERLYHVDAFVARYGTGSMFVSRVLQRPGVVHHSGLANYEDAHLQGPEVASILGIPAERDPDTKVHSISYDVEWEHVARELLTILRRRSVPSGAIPHS